MNMSIEINGPLFSIITVTFNDVDGLKTTYKSILNQKNQHFEWVVIDGGSDDGTCNFLESLDLPYLKWISEPDQGIYYAMNKGIDMAKNDYVVFMNAGDVFDSKRTLNIVENTLLKDAVKADVLWGGASYIFDSGREHYIKPKLINKYIWHGIPANHQATYYKREVLSHVKYDTRYRICGDYFLACSLYLLNVKSSYLDENLVNFRVGDTSFQNKKKLFLEPYMIQRDVLKTSIILRLVSWVKRGLAVSIGMLFQSSLLSSNKKIKINVI